MCRYTIILVISFAVITTMSVLFVRADREIVLEEISEHKNANTELDLTQFDGEYRGLSVSVSSLKRNGATLEFVWTLSMTDKYAPWGFWSPETLLLRFFDAHGTEIVQPSVVHVFLSAGFLDGEAQSTSIPIEDVSIPPGVETFQVCFGISDLKTKQIPLTAAVGSGASDS